MFSVHAEYGYMFVGLALMLNIPTFVTGVINTPSGIIKRIFL
jgi:hypothetical protein